MSISKPLKSAEIIFFTNCEIELMIVRPSIKRITLKFSRLVLFHLISLSKFTKTSLLVSNNHIENVGIYDVRWWNIMQNQNNVRKQTKNAISIK